MPATIVPYADWMEETAVTMRIRSSQLKELDAAIKNFESLQTKQAFEVVKTKLAAWKAAKGAGWKLNDRNKTGIITKLDGQLAEGWKDYDASTVAAWKELAKLRKEFMRQLFAGARVTFGGVSKTAPALQEFANASYKAGTIATAGRQLATGAVSSSSNSVMAATAASAMATVISRIRAGMASEAAKVFSEMGLGSMVSLASFETACNTAFQQVVGRAVSDLAAAIAPYVGIASSAAKTAFYAYCAANSTADLYNVSVATQVIETGDPLVAMAAVSELVKRELATNSLKLASSAADLTLKAVGGIFDGGTLSTVAAGLATTAAQALWDIRCAIRDVAEMTAANTLLANAAALDNSVFVKAPLVGAYYICCADDSTLLNLVLDKDDSVPAGFGTPSFMRKIEQAKKNHLDKVQTLANHLVNSHRMKILMGSGIIPKLGLGDSSNDKGMTNKSGDLAMRSPNMMMQLKREARSIWQSLQNSARTVGHKVTSKVDAPNKPVTVDKSRIVGMGPKKS